MHFNSHPHEEDDDQQLGKASWLRYFNSHPHEEDDELLLAAWLEKLHFNSHPHEEDDKDFDQKEKKNRISTHILTKRMIKNGMW